MSLPYFLLCAFCSVSLLPVATASQPAVLVYSATAAFRHDSIPVAVEALEQHVSKIGAHIEATEDETAFRMHNLARFDAVIFLSNTGEVLTQAGKEAFQNYLNQGGNFIGIHSASNALITSEWFGKEVGAFFDYHPEITNATVNVMDESHPITSMLPTQWRVYDEMYNFKSDPRALNATILLSADESSYSDSGVRRYDQGSPHPLAWSQEHGAGASGTAGRSFYTSLGHTNETWQDEVFLGHVLGGIRWALAAHTTRAFNASAQVGNADQSSSSSSSNVTPSTTATSSSSGTRHSHLSFAIYVLILVLTGL